MVEYGGDGGCCEQQETEAKAMKTGSTDARTARLTSNKWSVAARGLARLGNMAGMEAIHPPRRCGTCFAVISPSTCLLAIAKTLEGCSRHLDGTLPHFRRKRSNSRPGIGTCQATKKPSQWMSLRQLDKIQVVTYWMVLASCSMKEEKPEFGNLRCPFGGCR